MTAARIPCSAAARSSGGSPLIRARTMKLRMEASTSSADNSCTGSPSVVLAIRSERRLRAYFLNIRHPWTIDRHQEAMVMSGEVSKISAGELNADPRALQAPTEDFDSSCVLCCSESEPVVTRRSRQNQVRRGRLRFCQSAALPRLGFLQPGRRLFPRQEAVDAALHHAQPTHNSLCFLDVLARSFDECRDFLACGLHGRSSNVEQACCHGGSRVNY